jgi:hypothetical protein
LTISPGFTTAEIREFVHEYELQPYGHKGSWLAARGISYKRMRRWADAVFEGDLDRGLIPREGSAMNVPPSKRSREHGGDQPARPGTTKAARVTPHSLTSSARSKFGAELAPGSKIIRDIPVSETPGTLRLGLRIAGGRGRSREAGDVRGR